MHDSTSHFRTQPNTPRHKSEAAAGRPHRRQRHREQRHSEIRCAESAQGTQKTQGSQAIQPHSHSLNSQLHKSYLLLYLLLFPEICKLRIYTYFIFIFINNNRTEKVNLTIKMNQLLSHLLT